MDTLTIDLGDVELVADAWGDSDSPLALLLHGFPDTRKTWRHLGPHMAERGYFVVAPNTRGYAPSSVSRENNYATVALAHDALRLHEYFDADERAVLIGHDWGAASTYPALTYAPEKWSRAITLAVPPIAVALEALNDYEQRKRLWYMYFFQLPFADVVVAHNDYEMLEGLWRDWSPRYDATQDLVHVKEALASPESLGAALNYYRAMFATLASPTTPELDDISAALARDLTTPVLYLHGENDGCFVPTSVASVERHLPTGSRVALLADAGHFLHLEQPALVASLVDEFLGVS